MFIQIEKIIDCILVMPVFDQHSSGLFNVILVFSQSLQGHVAGYSAPELTEDTWWRPEVHTKLKVDYLFS